MAAAQTYTARSTFAERYVMGPELASGGMATVFLGRRLGPAGFSPTVAIKRMHPWLAKEPSFSSMFADEARLAAHLRHPNIVPTLDVLVSEGDLQLVMEYVHGESLGRLIDAARQADEPIALPIVSAIMSGVLSGLHAAHEAVDEEGKPLGIVHRDVTPQNVMVGIDGLARVVDFGVARAYGQIHTTREGHLKGKLGYAAPEQLKDGRIDRRADVYAAGVVLWEMLTLRRLFQGETEVVLLHEVSKGATTPPGKLRENLPPALDALVMRALGREPSSRFGTAREMAMALERCIPPASPVEVGAWVSDLARRQLAARSEQIASFRVSSPPPLAPSPAVENAPSTSAVVVPRSSDRRIAPKVLVAAAALVMLAVLLVVLLRREGPAPQAATPRPEPAPPPVAESVSPPPALASPAVSPTLSRPRSIELPPSPPPAPPPPRVEKRKRNPCEPPYWTDGKGIRHYKVECAPQ